MRLETVLRMIREIGLKVNVEKCKFVQPEVRFLGRSRFSETSSLGLGAVWYQVQRGSKKAIAYASRRLWGSEKND